MKKQLPNEAARCRYGSHFTFTRGERVTLASIGNIFLPPTVVVELHAHAPDLWSSVLPEWAKIQSLSPVNQSLAGQWHHANLLHTGEAEALALSLEIKPDWFLTDDAAARLMAESLGVEVHGSIGVVLWLAVNHLLEKQEADKYLTGLENSSLWISPKVRMAARNALKNL